MWFDPAQLMQYADATSATLATSATFTPVNDGKVARVAKVATPPEAKTANAATSWGWLVHFADREPVEVYCNPDADFANIMQTYPDALAAEPIPERTRRTPTEAEAAELRALVQAIGKAEEWTADEIEWAMAGALADPDGALICFQDIAGGFNAAVENNDRTVNDSPENRHQSGDNK